tara:strand:+ start:748 stop:1014 length:267 start_codon:yes stop_codon:yes gene_type:complete
MTIPSPEKEARGRKAAESFEKSDAELFENRQKNKERFEDNIKNAKPLRLDKDGNVVKPSEKKGFVYPDEPRSKKAKELLRKGKVVGYT